jgi:Calcineurin-like phosphoesterase
MAFLRALAFACILCAVSALAQTDAGVWTFAVSGDSRNCGDIVMPAIAAAVHASGAEFYWHLGDFRAIYTFDEDMPQQTSIAAYEAGAWPDFIEHQLVPFGQLPVFLAIGNHETIPPATRESWLIQFADWLDSPLLRAQRLQDDAHDRKLHAYYHWVSHGVDFITLDNASKDQFDDAQLRWFKGVVERDEASARIRAIVVGMHEALPGSIGAGHSMEAWPQGRQSGRAVYEELWRAQDSAHKRVYLVASHSHLFMQDVYDTAEWKGRVLPGWIVGTAGAVRYPLPEDAGPHQKTRIDVYGYVTGTVSADGLIAFAFHELSLDDLMGADQGKHSETLVKWCFSENKE